IDIVVNGTGIGGETSFVDTSVAARDRMMAVHLRGTFLVTRAVFPGMLERGWGWSSTGIVGFTRALSYEGAPRGVLVNSRAPGPVDTDLLATFGEEWRAMKQAQLQLGRFGRWMR
ncbi:SDR family NAD(P)-dependent oxidoreductase, partial [Paracraurococcus lichenis]